MNKLPKEAFAAVYQLAREKAAYDAQVKDWKRPSGLAGLFARPPRDPWPDGMDSVRTLCRKAFDGAWPELNAFRSGPAGVDDRKAKAEVSVSYEGVLTGQYHTSSDTGRTFHTEHYEFKPGYGFRHQYSHSEDRELDARNRNLAYSRAMESRFTGDPFFDAMNRKVDKMCNEMRCIENTSFTRKEIRDYIRMVNEYDRERHAALAEAGKVRMEGGRPVTDLDSYIDVACENERLLVSVQKGRMEESSPLVRARYDVNRQALAAHSMKLGQEIADSVSPAVPREDLLAFSKVVFEHRTGRNPDEPENKAGALCVFADLARRDGWNVDDILKEAKADAQHYGAVMDQRDWRDVASAISGVDGQRAVMIANIVRGGVASGESVADIQREVVDKFDADMRERVSRHQSIVKGIRILSELSDDLGNRLPREKEIAERLYGMRNPFSLESMSDALSVVRKTGLDETRVMRVRESLESAMDDVYAGRLLEKAGKRGVVYALDDLGNWVSGKAGGQFESDRRSESSPSVLLARDMARAVLDLQENAPEKLGRFLREAGVKPSDRDDLVTDFMSAAKRMYGEGDADSSRKVMVFRERFKDQIAAGKTLEKSMLGNAPAQKVAPKKEIKKGLSLG